jgi:hypothetical protein
MTVNRIPQESTGRMATSIQVAEVSVTPDVRRPEAVAIVLGDANNPMPLVCLLASAEEANKVIRAIDEARASVWPASRGIVRR